MKNIRIELEIDNKSFNGFYFKETEKLSQPKEITIQFVSEEFILLNSMNKKCIKIKVSLKEIKKEVSALILKSKYLSRNFIGQYIYECVAYSLEKQLDLSLKTKIYLYKSLKDIVHEIFSTVYKNNQKIIWKLKQKSSVEKFFLQYRESDLSFVQRLLYEKKICYFINNDSIVFTDYLIFEEILDLDYKESVAYQNNEYKNILSYNLVYQDNSMLNLKLEIAEFYSGEGQFLANTLLSRFQCSSLQELTADKNLFFSALETEVNLSTQGDIDKFLVCWAANTKMQDIFELKTQNIHSALPELIIGIIDATCADEPDLNEKGEHLVYFPCSGLKQGSAQSSLRLPMSYHYLGHGFGLQGGLLKNINVLVQFSGDFAFITGLIETKDQNAELNDTQQFHLKHSSGNGLNLDTQKASIGMNSNSTNEIITSQINLINDIASMQSESCVQVCDTEIKKTKNLEIKSETVSCGYNNTQVSIPGINIESRFINLVFCALPAITFAMANRISTMNQLKQANPDDPSHLQHRNPYAGEILGTVGSAVVPSSIYHNVGDILWNTHIVVFRNFVSLGRNILLVNRIQRFLAGRIMNLNNESYNTRLIAQIDADQSYSSFDKEYSNELLTYEKAKLTVFLNENNEALNRTEINEVKSLINI